MLITVINSTVVLLVLLFFKKSKALNLSLSSPFLPPVLSLSLFTPLKRVPFAPLFIVTVLLSFLSPLFEYMAELWELIHPWWTLSGVLLILLLGISLLLFRKAKAIIAFSNNQGQAKIEYRALKDFVRRTVLAVEGVHKCKVRFRLGWKGKLNITLRVRLKNSYQFSGIAKHIQEQITLGMEKGLGLECLGSIDVTAAHFTGKIEPNPPSAPAINDTQPAEETGTASA